MEYTTLGNTGLRVSRMGLGCGGPSKIGLRTEGEASAKAIVRRSFELGVNFFDTAATYGTEPILGEVFRDISRDEIVVSSKRAATDRNEQLVSGDEFMRGIEGSLERLGLEYIDVYHIHALRPGEYDYAMEHLVPAMIRAREQGKIRHIGVTEEFIPDTGHKMLSLALSNDGPWEVVMVGFNLLNPCARERVFPMTMKKGVGTLIMFAVRRALSQPEKLAALLEDLERRGLIETGVLPADQPLGFLIGQEGARSVPEAAYRFCRHEPGSDVILCGTGSIEHLEENAKAICAPALPADMLGRLRTVFGKVDCVSGN